MGRKNFFTASTIVDDSEDYSLEEVVKTPSQKVLEEIRSRDCETLSEIYF